MPRRFKQQQHLQRLQRLRQRNDPVSPSNAAGEALAAHAQQVAAAPEATPAEDPVSPTHAVGEALAAHAKEVESSAAATEGAATAEASNAEEPVSPSNTAGEALAAHAKEVEAATAAAPEGTTATEAVTNAEELKLNHLNADLLPVSPTNAVGEALAAHAQEVGAATEPSPPAEDPISPSTAGEAEAAHPKEEVAATDGGATNTVVDNMKEVDTSLSDEEIVAKALSEHLKQVSEADAIDKALAEQERQVAENDQVVAQALAEQAEEEAQPKEEEKPAARDLHTSYSMDSFQSQSPKTMNRSVRSSPGFSSHSDDLKSRLQFSSMTEGGVKKGPTFMHTVSNHKTGARWTFGQKGQSTFFNSTDSPPPGAYNLPSGPGAASGGKYKKPPNFSFGPSEKKQPGPGAYNPKDPLLTAGPKVSFTGGNSGRGLPLPENAPGPGAYEQRSSLGKSKMFTARGRALNSSARSRSQPGPGAYDPKVNAVLMGIPRCGFGTATRQDITGGSSLFGPGPGAYDLQNAMSLGKNGPKYSATSRRRVHDLDSYVTPGPGTYNAHTTSFVY
eukprot:s825_g23.t1